MGLQRTVFKALVAADDSAAALNANENTISVGAENIQEATIVASGTFGGGTATVQITVDGTTFVSSGLTLTATGKVQLTIPCKAFRVALTGATGPSVICAAAMRTYEGQ
jgi:hypothetical protein